MQVVATAGHVDHGKSALVQALTGMQPDRWAEEQRRSLTIDLGFAWTELPSGATAAFVDVPGHERFITNMLAGVGPVPAVMFVVAADEGWAAQSAEHLAALDAYGVRHGLLVVSKSDLADPEPARSQALEQIVRTSLGRVESVCVSAATKVGLHELLAALDRLVARLPVPDPDAPVRLWIDRAFTIRGAGTVVTGTLPAGTVRAGDELAIAPGGRRVRVRRLQTLKQPADQASGLARVALNLRHVTVEDVRRGHALITPGAWVITTQADVGVGGDLPRQIRCHVGAAALTARVRALGPCLARLSFGTALPLHVGDRVLLRDPGNRRITAATVLDPSPPALGRRGAAAARARELHPLTGGSDAATQVQQRGVVRARDLLAMGIDPPYPPVVDDWVADPDHWAALQHRLGVLVDEHVRRRPQAPGVPIEEAKRRLDLPDRRLVEVLAAPPLVISAGHVTNPVTRIELPDRVRVAVDALLAELAENPYASPTAHRLADLGLDPRALALAARAGALLRVAADVYLAPNAADGALEILATLSEPFTVSQARAALATTRRATVPLLEHLDRQGCTERVDDQGRRRVMRPDPATTSDR